MKITIHKKLLRLVLVIMILVEPGYIAANVFWLDRIWDILKIFSAVLLILYLIRKRTCSLFIGMQLLFIGSLFFSTIMNGVGLREWFLQNSYTLLLCWYLDISLQEDAKCTLRALFYVLFVYSAVNFITYCMFPDGMYIDMYLSPDCWFLGRDNSAALMLVSAMIFSFLYAAFVRKKVTAGFVLCHISSYFFMLFVWSATSVVAMTILIFLELLVWNGKMVFVDSMKKSFLCGALINIGIVGFQSLNILTFLIENILKKSVDLAGRMKLWDRVIYLIAQEPFWGYGIENTLIKIQKFGISWAGTAHNYFLNIAYQGGLAAIFILIIIYIIIAQKFDTVTKCDRSRIIPAAVFVVTLMFVVEAYQGNAWFWILLLCAANIEKIEYRNPSGKDTDK